MKEYQRKAINEVKEINKVLADLLFNINDEEYGDEQLGYLYNKKANTINAILKAKREVDVAFYVDMFYQYTQNHSDLVDRKY